MLYQLSYTPGLGRIVRAGIVDRRMAAPSQRRALGALFLVIAAAFFGFAATAASAGGRAWVIAIVAGILALWMLQLSWQMLRPRNRR